MTVSPWLDDGDVRLFLGDCLEVMGELPADSVDAVVTDPPYALEFMGRSWDAGLPDPAVWREALRVLRPGGHLLAFGGTRTFHRLTCAIEDAGFEVRDCLSWLYGSGFPKSLDVSKAITATERHGGANSVRIRRARLGDEYEATGRAGNRDGMGGPAANRLGDDPTRYVETALTPEAAAWQGWGTALKPAWEPIILARRPLAGTVAGNVLAHGTGAINVDGCRVGKGESGGGGGGWGAARHSGGATEPHSAGRWPANVVVDEAAAAQLDGEVGERPSGDGAAARSALREIGWTPEGEMRMTADGEHARATLAKLNRRAGEESADRRYAERGGTDFAPLPGVRREPVNGVSRFFYTAKASSAERDGASHPTVKPLALMRWLVRLVTPPGGLVLDPFAGSGTTGLACREEGARVILIEREREYAAMAAHRLRQLTLL